MLAKQREIGICNASMVRDVGRWQRSKKLSSPSHDGIRALDVFLVIHVRYSQALHL